MNKSITTKPIGASDGKMESIVDQAKQTVSNVASTAKEGVSQQLDLRKEKATETIGGVADAVRDMGKKLEGPLPDLAERAADGIDRVAEFFESRDVAGVIGSVESFAKREPALFLGSALALGLFAGRFLKSSSHRGGGIDDSGSRYGFAGEDLDRPYGHLEDADIYEEDDEWTPPKTGASKLSGAIPPTPYIEKKEPPIATPSFGTPSTTGPVGRTTDPMFGKGGPPETIPSVGGNVNPGGNKGRL